MRPSPYPDWLDHVWAKSPEKGEDGRPESLAQHTWAVLARLAEFIRLRPDLPAQLGRPDFWQILYWAAFLHDFGKVVPAFQGVLRADRLARDRWQGHRHEVFSLAFMDWVSPDLTPEQLNWIGAAIVSHHRDWPDIASLYPPPDEDDEDILSGYLAEINDETLRGIWLWLANCSFDWMRILGLDRVGVAPLSLLPAEKAVAKFQERGVKNITQRLLSYRKMMRSLGEQPIQSLVSLLTLRGYMINADHSGSAHAGPLPNMRFEAHRIIESRKIDEGALYSHQIESANTMGSVLLVAPTGSGKTEAALLWASRQSRDSVSTPRLFYTLPYQASMNAMSLRLREIFGFHNVGLQHGRGLLALYRQLMERDYNPQSAAQTAKRMRNLADLNYPPVRVFSPYQMLKAMYRLKGYEAQLSDYHEALFVFDEIHAYEVQRLAMILSTMTYLQKNYHARFFVMSATFPEMIRERLRAALNGPVEIRAQPALFSEFQRHRIRVVDGDLSEERYIAQIVEEARAGKSVLVVCNVVVRAQNTYMRIKECLGDTAIPVELLHGRFNLRDRSRKEQFIRDQVDTRREEHTPIVLVATQVVEVSLDIDLDTIYTDPAPLDALVQRFGRINRGRRNKALALLHIFTQPCGGQKVYDEELVVRTMHILSREDGKAVDENAIGDWLNEIYSGAVAERWESDYERASREFEAACVNSLRPFEADPSLETQFYRAFDGIDVLPDSLLAEYLQIKDEDPILAGELLVSISWGRYHALTKSGQLLPGDKSVPPVVTAPYTPEMGLLFTEKRNFDVWD